MGLFGLSGRNATLVSSLALLVLLFSVMVFIPQALGLGKGGFNITGIFEQFKYYLPTGTIFGIIILLCVLVDYFVVKGDIIYGNGLGFLSPGDTPHPKFKWFDNQVRLFLACLIIFSVIGLSAGVTKQTYFGLGSLEQQFTKTDDIAYNATLVATSENLGLAALIAVIILSLRMYARKQKWSRANFVAMSWLIVLPAGIAYGVTNHLMRYGSEDMNIVAVGVIWGIGAAMTMLTGSFIPFWVLHIVNNTFFELGSAFSSDFKTLYIWGFVILMSALFLWLYVFRTKKASIHNGS